MDENIKTVIGIPFGATFNEVIARLGFDPGFNVISAKDETEIKFAGIYNGMKMRGGYQWEAGKLHNATMMFTDVEGHEKVVYKILVDYVKERHTTEYTTVRDINETVSSNGMIVGKPTVFIFDGFNVNVYIMRGPEEGDKPVVVIEYERS